MNDITFIGAYLVDIPNDEYNIIVASNKNAASELANLALIEIEVRYADKDFDLTFIKQPHTDSVPYDETYYDGESLEDLSCWQPMTDCFRVAFYLHYFDAAQPIETPWGKIRCGAPTRPPKHLQNKKYIYWA